MKRFIFGTGLLADVLAYELKSTGVEVEGFVVENGFRDADRHAGLPVRLFSDFDAEADREVGIYVCVGYKAMNTHRERIFVECKKRGLSVLTFVHPSATVLTDDIGEGNLVFEDVTISPFIRIGNCNVFMPKSILAHHSSCGDFNFFSVSASVAGVVEISDHCFFGNNCTIRDHVKVSDSSLIGAGAYLSHDTSPGDVIVPARGVTLDKRSHEFL